MMGLYITLLFAFNLSLNTNVISLGSIRYEEVKIGTQIWMTRNLDVEKFNNGEKILEAKTAKEWKEACDNKLAAWCYTNDSKGQKSKLYNFYAVADSRGLSPKGWHVASDSEWKVLTDFLGGETSCSNELKSKTGWKKNTGNNLTGFSAYPYGSRSPEGTFDYISTNAFFWTSTSKDDNSAKVRYIYCSGDEIFDFFNRYNNKGFGYSIRCIKDNY